MKYTKADIKKVLVNDIEEEIIGFDIEETDVHKKEEIDTSLTTPRKYGKFFVWYDDSFSQKLEQMISSFKILLEGRVIVLLESMAIEGGVSADGHRWMCFYVPFAYAYDTNAFLDTKDNSEED